MMKKIIMLAVLIVSLFLIACVPEEKQCNEDVDCAPSVCCHASDAVNRDFAPDCAGQLCTAECVSGTIDCGQGQVECFDNECQVTWNEV